MPIGRNISLQQHASALQLGDKHSFDYFFHLHYPALCLFSYKITRNKELSEEIAEDAFLKLWQQHENFSHPATIKSFLFTVTKNASLNALRQQKKESLLLAQQKYLAEHSEDFILNKIIAAEIHADVHAAIAKLPPQCSRIFRMIFIEGKEYSQVAEELQLTISTIRNQKARAITLLRNRLFPVGDP